MYGTRRAVERRSRREACAAAAATSTAISCLIAYRRRGNCRLNRVVETSSSVLYGVLRRGEAGGEPEIKPSSCHDMTTRSQGLLLATTINSGNPTEPYVYSVLCTCCYHRRLGSCRLVAQASLAASGSAVGRFGPSQRRISSTPFRGPSVPRIRTGPFGV